MNKLKLHRDQARSIEENFFNLMRATAEMKLRQAKPESEEFYSCKVLLTLLLEVQVLFKRKLLGNAIKFSFTFNDAQAITFYKFLMAHPIRGNEIHLINLRQHVCNVLHAQIIK